MSAGLELQLAGLHDRPSSGSDRSSKSGLPDQVGTVHPIANSPDKVEAAQCSSKSGFALLG